MTLEYDGKRIEGETILIGRPLEAVAVDYDGSIVPIAELAVHEFYTFVPLTIRGVCHSN